MTAQTDLSPVSKRQHAFWTLSQLAPDSAVSNLSVAFRTSGTLRWWPVCAAVNHLVARHPALRTRFPEHEGMPVRQVCDPQDAQVDVLTVPATPEELADRVHKAARQPFDLAVDLPVRVTLFQLTDGGSAVLLTVHHIVGDAVSLAVLTGELAAAYDGFAADDEAPVALRGVEPVPAEPVPSEEDLRFWVDHLRGLDPQGVVLPWAGPSPARPTFAGRTILTRMSDRTADAVERLRRELRTTENIVLLAAFYLTLHRHGAAADLVVGVPVSTRQEMTGIGFGVSTLPMRLRIDRDAGFRELARRVRDVFLAGVGHSGVSVESLLTELGHRSGDWRAPVFRHLYNYRPWDETDIRIGGERPEFLALNRDESRLDFDLTVLGGMRPPVLIVNFSTEVHEEQDIRALVARMTRLLEQAADQPDHPVGTLDVLSEAERALLDGINERAAGRPVETTVPQRILAAAATTPDAVAIVADGVGHTYAELLADADRVTGSLRAAGAGPGSVVGLAGGRTVRMAAAILGTWAAGASYLPLDPAQPADRLAYQVDDADVRVVLCTDAEPAPWAGDRPVLRWDDLARPDGTAPAADLTATAYVMYTSGSTGRPKGVAVTHRNLANVVRDFAERLAVGPGDAVLWSTAVTFDISALELLLPLSVGGRVVIADAITESGPADLVDLVAGHDVRVLQGTPTFWRAVVPYAADRLQGRTVLCGGEPLSPQLAADLLATGCRLVNVYGPTETTIWSTCAPVTAVAGGTVPIGVPIANTQVFVLDEHGVELPPGLVGELCVAGDGVSAGYLNQAELTAERFGTHPRWGRFYRTGDLARWRHDGVLECLGRSDRQVKVRGHRIELGEIEAVLREHDDVADAAAVLTGDPQRDGELRAFVRPATGAAAAGLPDRLWQHLRTRLPSGSLPTGIAVVDDFPVTANGKLDLRALADRALPDTAGVAPDAPDADPELTGRLTELWRATLGRPDVREHDNFFLNGGHSLLAARLGARLVALGYDVGLRVVFDHPTARALSAYLTSKRGDDARR